MTKNENRQWLLGIRPTGNLTGEEFRWNETSIPQPSDGQVLVRNLWLSVDPAQRTWMMRDSYKPKVPLGEVMQSFAVGQELESLHPDFKTGDLVRGDFGWQDYAATRGTGPVAPGRQTRAKGERSGGPRECTTNVDALVYR